MAGTRLSTVAAAVHRHRWALAFTLTGSVIVALRLSALGTVPPGLHSDEASIGYNAWSIAHHGVDEHGHRFPLYFEAFGEYKNPLYIYLLAPLTLVLPLTPSVERLPAALCGLGTVAAVAGIAWTLTRRHIVALAALVTAAVTPWLVLQSRVGFELPVMTLTLALAILFYARGTQDERWGRRWLFGAGMALGLSVFAYSTGRAFVAGAVVLMVIADVRWRRPQIRPLLLPVVVAYVVLGLDVLRNPGALTNRFSAVSITADSPGPLTAAGRLVGNLASYWGIPFLFTSGDSNLRHNTGYGGMLLLVTLPLMVLGLLVCLRRRREPVPRLVLVMLMVAPVPAALTAEGTPHALRADPMLPVLLVVIAFGWAEWLPWLTPRRLLAGLVALLLAADATGFMWDLYGRYPGRAVLWFDTGELPAIERAHDLAAAGGHHVYISGALDIPYIQVLFALRPPPVSQPWPSNQAAAMAEVGVSVLPSFHDMAATAEPGDLLVMRPSETPPTGATLVDTEEVTVAPQTRPTVLVVVYRR